MNLLRSEEGITGVLSNRFQTLERELDSSLSQCTSLSDAQSACEVQSSLEQGEVRRLVDLCQARVHAGLEEIGNYRRRFAMEIRSEMHAAIERERDEIKAVKDSATEDLASLQQVVKLTEQGLLSRIDDLSRNIGSSSKVAAPLERRQDGFGHQVAAPANVALEQDMPGMQHRRVSWLDDGGGLVSWTRASVGETPTGAVGLLTAAVGE